MTITATIEEQLYTQLRDYKGDNYFALSLKAQLLRNGALSDRQVKSLAKFYLENPTTKIKEEEQKEMSNFVITVLEDETTSALPKENASHVDMQAIENKMQAIAAKVVQETMRDAQDKANAILKTCEKLSTGRPVMHIKLGDDKPKKLTHEASPYLPKMLANARMGLNTLLVGPAGTGKTTMATQLAEALDLSFGMLSCTAGMSESWLYGRQFAEGTKEGLFSQFYKNGGVFLLDEIDAADANFLVGPNAALENGLLYNPITNEMIKRHENFVCVGAANTYGLGSNAQYTGRSRLDAATLERFVTLSVDYNENLEAKLCDDKKLYKKLSKARKKLKEKNAREFISTRQFIRIPKLLASGAYTEKEAFATFTDSWPQGLAEEIGLYTNEAPEANSSEIPF